MHGEECLVREDQSVKSDEINSHNNGGTESAKAKYFAIYKEMVNKLSVTDLKPFVDVLRKHKKFQLQKQDEILETFKRKLLNDMEREDETFWERFDVANGLKLLEELKVKFKDYEGTNWYEEQSAEKRALPLRMYFKKAECRILQKKVDQQKIELQDLLTENKKKRGIMQEAFQTQSILKEEIERCLKSMEKLKPQLEQCKKELEPAFVSLDE